MTGFGSAEGNVLGGRLSIEIRSVNHRYYNPQLKLPFELGGIKGALLQPLAQLLGGGTATGWARGVHAAQRGGARAAGLRGAPLPVAPPMEGRKGARPER